MLLSLKLLTRLDEPNVEDFVHLTVVCGDVKNAFGRVLDAGDVDGYEIFWDLLPLYLSGATCSHMEHFRPQPKYTNDI